MNQVSKIANDLNNLLQLTASNFKCQEDVHFDWLRSISAQLDFFDDNLATLNSKKHMYKSPKPVRKQPGRLGKENINTTQLSVSESKTVVNKIPYPKNSIKKHTPKHSNTKIKFCGFDSLINSPSEDDLLFNSSTYKSCAYESSSYQDSFSVNSRSSLKERSSSSSLRDFELNNMPTMNDYYEISDDEGSMLVNDDEIYQNNPIEIHGKFVPLWARKENLIPQLRGQSKVNPDTIFIHFPKTCDLSIIFNNIKPEALQRSDSDIWDRDDIA